jgi:protein-tyrosine phosphatase
MRKLDYSKITDSLYVGKTPRGKDYAALKDLGITLVINMRVEWPSPIVSRQKQLPELWLPLIDTRFTPYSQKRLLSGAQAAVEAIEKGGKVYVYCRMGRHRSVAMAAAILIRQGHSPTSLAKLINQQRPVADLQASQVRRAIAGFQPNQPS